MIAEAIKKLIDRRDLERREMYDVFGYVMDGKATDVQKSAFLIALRMKGETADEITGAAMAMRERVTPLQTNGADVIDTCGTGGDGRGTFNISTVAAIVAAAAGAMVAKHGNRAVSSSCGSADLLTELGVTIDLDAPRMSEVLRRAGISFLFAPKLHPAMGAVMGVRRELGVRTVFNVLGPLPRRPASVKFATVKFARTSSIPNPSACRGIGSKRLPAAIRARTPASRARSSAVNLARERTSWPPTPPPRCMWPASLPAFARASL